MFNSLSPSMQMSVGSGHINASWINDTAIWISDYHPDENQEYEEVQFDIRSRILKCNFEIYKLGIPQIEIIVPDAEEAIGPFIEQDHLGACMILSVTTLLMPYVDPSFLRPIPEFRAPAPTYEEVERTIVAKDLRAGGAAIYHSFDYSMAPRV